MLVCFSMVGIKRKTRCVFFFAVRIKFFAGQLWINGTPINIFDALIIIFSQTDCVPGAASAAALTVVADTLGNAQRQSARCTFVGYGIRVVSGISHFKILDGPCRSILSKMVVRSHRKPAYVLG